MGTNLKDIRAVVVTVSDSCARGERQDASGPACEAFLVSRGVVVMEKFIVPDEENVLVQVLKNALGLSPDLLVTSGGTGLGPRDLTPEATRRVIEKEVPGLSEAMRSAGVLKTKNALLSRGICGLSGKTLVLNLPGSPKGAVESLEAVMDVIPHALSMIQGEGHA